MFTPDPLSVWWEPAAARLLDRVEAARRDTWIGVRLEHPTRQHIDRAAALELPDPRGPDPVPGRLAKTAWVRSFVRAIERLNRQRRGLPLQFEVGARKPATGVFPAGTAFRVRARPGGQAALRAVARMPAGRRIFNPDGTQGPRSADLSWRDWEDAETS